MNEILDRFARAEHLLANQIKIGEIVRTDERILFQTSTDTSAAGCFGCAAIWSGWAFVLLMGAWSFVAAYQISVIAFWLFTAFIIAALGALGFYLWTWSSKNGSFRQYKLFEIDTANGVINVPKPDPTYAQKEETIAIEDIYCFYGWHVPGSDSNEEYIYAVDKKDQTTVLCERFLLADRTAQIVGFLCDKAVYRRGLDGKISPLTEFRSELEAS